MPIRIKKDDNTSTQSTRPRQIRNNPSTGGGGAGMLGALAPLLINMFKKNPKVLVVLLVIGVAVYFLGGKEACSSGAIVSPFSTGFVDNLEKYDATEVFEPLADNIKNPLPNSVSLLKYAPRRLNQGSQGSCVGWSSSYAARTILQAKMTGEDPNSIAFSPSFLYNQIALPNCQGTYLSEAMKSLHTVGDLHLTKFKYNEYDCETTPNSSQKQEASQFKIKGYNRLTVAGDKYKPDLLAIKQNLAQGAPVVIGMMVGGTFMQDMQGEKVWLPTEADYNQRGFGGHAMCVIGYDDYLEGGAFQIMNSWGPSWGDNGVAWVKYADFDYFTKEAYGLYPMGDAEKFNTSKFNVKFGLIENKSGRNIPFKKVNGITFRTTEKLKKNTEFKIESTNSIECYTYVFGQETDGSSYVLFPYTPKHSPYCGITGTRLFPKDHSLYPDEIGSRDYMTIIVTKEPIDYNQLNTKISQASGATYAEKVTRALQSDMLKNVNYETSGGTINVSCDTKGKNILAVVLEIDK